MKPARLTWSDWTFEPTVTCGLVALVVLYVLAWRRGLLSARDDVSPWLPTSWLRPWFFGAGLLVSWVALESPIDTGGDLYLFSLHMLQHLLLMMVGPPLGLLGIVGMRPLATGRWTRVRTIGRWITRPWAACLIFNAIMLVWHYPPYYDTTLTVEPVHIFEHITFIVGGVILWWPVVDPFRHPGTRPVAPLTKIGMLVVAGVPPTILGFIFAMAPAPLYAFYAVAPRLWGLSPVVDQQIGGVLMLGLGNLIYFVAVTIILARLLSAPEPDDEEAVPAVLAVRGSPRIGGELADPAATLATTGE